MDILNIKKYKYDIDRVLDHFGLERGTDCDLLRTFVNTPIPPDFSLPPLMEEQRELLEKEGDVWNEEELKMHFLSFVFKFSDIQVPKKIKLFYERTLTGVVQDTPLSVVCDAMLATPLGINTPRSPYFFLQEFKKGKKAQDDAEGQMLVAMLIAQAQNQNDKPIYGCYLQGRNWYFATLHHKNYCLSSQYDAIQTNNLVQIIHILKNIKNIVSL